MKHTNDYGMNMYHNNNKPMLWYQQGYTVRYVILNNLKRFFKDEYMRFIDMSTGDFEILFENEIKEIKVKGLEWDGSF